MKCRKIWIVLLAAAMVFALAACSGSSSESDSSESASSATAAAEPEESAEVAEEPEDPEETEAVESEEEPPEEVEDTDSAEPYFEPVTLADDENLTVTVDSYDPDGSYGPTFSLTVENKTEDVTLMFSVSDVSVNGVMCDPYWAKEVTPGNKAKSDMDFSSGSLANAGINYVETVELTLRAYDSDDWMADDYFNEVVTLTVENAGTGDSTYRRTSEIGYAETVLADTDDVLVTVIDYDPDDSWGPTFVLYIENRTDKNITVSSDGVSVNGYMCDPYWATSVAPGKCKYSEMDWSSSTLEENGIEAIETVQLTLKVYDSNDWMADYLVEQVVEFSAS